VPTLHRALFLRHLPSFMHRRILALVILLTVSADISARAQSSSPATVQIAAASSCRVWPPAIDVSGAQQSVGAGATVQYDVTVTNRDSPGCRASTFNLRGWVEDGWAVDMQPLALTIASGSSAHATLRVTSPKSAAARNYSAWAGASDTATIAHNGSAAGAYAVVSNCFLASPSMTVTPVMQSGVAGATFVYNVTITNHDSPACPPTAFRVQPEVPADWQRVVSSSSFVLTAGQSQTLRIALTSPPGLTPSTDSLHASATDGLNPIHAASAELSYTVVPRPPSGLVAMAKPEIKQIQLRWTGSSADAGYVIMRNGKAAGLTMSTTWTDVAWSAGDTATYSVIATDFAGHASAPSNTATAKLSRRR
jgi:hypothetical protein